MLDPADRPTASEILQHEWFVKFGPDEQVPTEVDLLDTTVFMKLKAYKGVSYFKKAAMHMLVKISTQKELERMAQIFK